MRYYKKLVATSFIAALTVSNIHAKPDSSFHCYLLFGQSNMAGGGAGVPIGGSGAGTLIAADCDTSSRVKVLAFQNCNAGAIEACKSRYSIGRTTANWYTAFPALHECYEGVSPGDWFAKTILDSIREDIKIGLIPCALSGMSLNVFQKGSSAKSTVGPPEVNGKNAYPWVISRCQLAQQTGVIKGMLLHQGESGSGSGAPPWGTLAKMIFDSLKKDLGLPSITPVAVGELRQGNGLNKDIDAFAKSYPNCGLASSLNLGEQPDDAWHFNPEGMREFGKRYAKAFLALASQEYVPRKGTTNAIMPPRAAISRDLKSAKACISVYSLNGRAVRSFAATDAKKALFRLNAGGVYIVSYTLNDGRSATVPFFKE